MSAGIMVPELREPLSEGGRFGWPPAFIGFALAGYYLVGSLTSPFSGRFGDLLGARKLIITGGLLFGVSMVLIGYITSVWQFFIVYSVMLALTSSISMVPLMAAVNPWFRKRLGLGIGIMWAAGGVGAAVLAPVYSMLLVQFGWTATFVVIGLVGGAAILGLMPFFRNLPADKGLLPYGATENDPVPAKFDPDMAKLRLRIFQRQMKHTRAFWNLPVIHGMGCAGHGIVLIFVVDYAVTRGIDFTTGAVILTLINVFSIMGRFAVPIITERVGGKLIMATALSIQARRGGTAVFRSRCVGLLPVRVRVRDWIRRRDVGVSGGEPPILWHRGPVATIYWVPNLGSDDGAFCLDVDGRSGDSVRGICAGVRAVHGVQQPGRNRRIDAGDNQASAHTQLGETSCHRRLARRYPRQWRRRQQRQRAWRSETLGATATVSRFG